MNDEFDMILFGSTVDAERLKAPFAISEQVPKQESGQRKQAKSDLLPTRAEPPEGDRLPRAVELSKAPAGWPLDRKHEWIGPSKTGLGLDHDSIWWNESAVDYNAYRNWLEQEPYRLECLPALYGKTLIYPDGCQHWEVLIDCCEASIEREGIVLSDLIQVDDRYFRQCNHNKLLGSWRMDDETGEVSCRICGKLYENEVAQKAEQCIKANSQDAPTSQLF